MALLTHLQERGQHWVLEHDGYLSAEPRGYVFVSNLVRDWWRARHEFGYTPVSKRGV